MIYMKRGTVRHVALRLPGLAPRSPKLAVKGPSERPLGNLDDSAEHESWRGTGRFGWSEPPLLR